MNDAKFSPCSLYRYWLRRDITPPYGWGPKIVWLMLNPSTADCTVNDPTIRQCLAFSSLWGYAAMEVVNVYAWRATDPRALKMQADRIGPDNDLYIAQAVAGAELVMCAWGAYPVPNERLNTLRGLLAFNTTACLGVTKSGMPWHPLYRPHNLTPKIWSMPA